jgi:hypothetical protein
VQGREDHADRRVHGLEQVRRLGREGIMRRTRNTGAVRPLLTRSSRRTSRRSRTTRRSDRLAQPRLSLQTRESNLATLRSASTG